MRNRSSSAALLSCVALIGCGSRSELIVPPTSASPEDARIDTCVLTATPPRVVATRDDALFLAAAGSGERGAWAVFNRRRLHTFDWVAREVDALGEPWTPFLTVSRISAPGTDPFVATVNWHQDTVLDLGASRDLLTWERSRGCVLVTMGASGEGTEHPVMPDFCYGLAVDGGRLSAFAGREEGAIRDPRIVYLDHAGHLLGRTEVLDGIATSIDRTRLASGEWIVAWTPAERHEVGVALVGVDGTIANRTAIATTALPTDVHVLPTGHGILVAWTMNTLPNMPQASSAHTALVDAAGQIVGPIVRVDDHRPGPGLGPHIAVAMLRGAIVVAESVVDTMTREIHAVTLGANRIASSDVLVWTGSACCDQEVYVAAGAASVQLFFGAQGAFTPGVTSMSTIGCAR